MASEKGIFMVEEYLKKGKLYYYKNVVKNGNISKDLFRIDYNNEVVYLLCTFDGYILIEQMLIS
jgi:hypothetical protein